MTDQTDRDRGATVRQALSVAATGIYGVSFGALGVAGGLSLSQTCVLSLLMFTGGSQFAFVGVIGAGGSAAAAVASAGLLGARNALYGLQLAPILRATRVRRLLAAHLTIDETAAVATAQPEPARQRLGFWATGIAMFLIWNSSTVAGAVLGNAIGDPRKYGLDAAAAAAFLGLLWPRLRSSFPWYARARATAAAAAAVSLTLTPVVPAGIPVLVAALVAVLGAFWRRGA